MRLLPFLYIYIFILFLRLLLFIDPLCVFHTEQRLCWCRSILIGVEALYSLSSYIPSFRPDCDGRPASPRVPRHPIPSWRAAHLEGRCGFGRSFGITGPLQSTRGSLACACCCCCWLHPSWSSLQPWWELANPSPLDDEKLSLFLFEWIALWSLLLPPE